ncbi:MAG: 2Fe-2S iron-sulfur cluster-binding protein [Anaerolineales bacterium]
MPTITVENFGSFEVAAGTRLVNALEDAGIHILHRCGGNARCTTCRVQFHAGEPQQITAAEAQKWSERSESGYRLSCQCLVEDDMHLSVINTLQSSGLDDPGSRPADQITPEPEWVKRNS